MSGFTDSIVIHVRAGHGGAGAVSFRREKYLPFGGPDGGEGGKGGDLYIVANRSYYNLSHLFKNKNYSAEPGESGRGRNQNGAAGRDFYINVPPGTEIKDAETGELIADLIEDEKPVCVAHGGIGGKGNAHFKTSTFQTPRFSQPGMPGDEFDIILNLKLIADVGLVGLPNAGKSTLLSKLTNARPKIAAYPFTTLTPNLGVVETEKGFPYRIADIPGIIEGAHMGLGLGLSFLRHIERVKVIVFLIDVSEEDPLYVYNLLKSELSTYNEDLVNRPSCLVLSKIDLADDERIESVAKFFEGQRVIAVSSLENRNLEKLLCEMEGMLDFPEDELSEPQTGPDNAHEDVHDEE